MKACDAVAMASKSLTPQHLRVLWEYDAETRQFRWRVARGDKASEAACNGLSNHVSIMIERRRYRLL
jgi:hypothetical protein